MLQECAVASVNGALERRAKRKKKKHHKKK